MTSERENIETDENGSKENIQSTLKRMNGDLENFRIEISSMMMFPDEHRFRLLKLEAYNDKITKQIDQLKRLIR